MYREKIEAYIDAHRQEMLEDICTLCRINSEKMAYKTGKPFGEGTFQALSKALAMAERYGFHIKNHDNYVGTIDLNNGARNLDILGPSGCGSGRGRMDGNGALYAGGKRRKALRKRYCG